MHLKIFLGSQLLKDFSNLFFANIFQKVLGFIRELVIAFFLGSSILYANFLLLRVVADFFSQVTAGNALRANLLPKFTKFYEKNNEVSLTEVFRFSNKSSIYLFIMCFRYDYVGLFLFVSLLLCSFLFYNHSELDEI